MQAKEAGKPFLSKQLETLKGVLKDMPYTQKAKNIALAGAAISTILLAIAYRKWKKNYDQFVKPCSNLKGPAKDKCIDDGKKRAYQQQIATLKANMKSCDSSKNPISCKNIVNLRIQKLQKKIQTL
jgi:hypothetical protein